MRPLAGDATIVVRDCLGCATATDAAGGSVVFSAGGLSNGLNPCYVSAPVRRVTWSAIKGLYRP